METKVSPASAHRVEALFRQYRGPLLRYISGLLPNPADAAELLQETWLRLLRQDNLERLGEDARPYLFQVATNLVRDYFRQRKAYRADRHAPLDAPALDLELHVPAASIGLDDTLSRFKSALKALKPEVRNVFLLYRFYGLNHPQIATRLGLSVKTVQRHMVRATSALKATLEEET